MEYQIRRYRIEAEKMDEFVALWRDEVVPLRERRGFKVHGAWVIEDSNEFLWIIGYNGPEGIAAGNEAYYASEERRSMDPDPAQFILDGDHDFARRVL